MPLPIDGPEATRDGILLLSPAQDDRHVAELLQHDGLATLLFDLLSPDEERDGGKVRDRPVGKSLI